MGVDQVGLDQDLVTVRLLDRIRSGGAKVNVWTVNAPEAMRRAIDLGVDQITTDRPDVLREMLKSAR